ncbi:MAG TPA: hypothetical protein VJ890_00370 [Vineibacter sp.]|nr:hypothetical protein [Vineibacter sp.]
MKGLGASSKLNAEWPFLVYLKEIGRQAAHEWLTQHFDAIGQRSTVDIRAKFLRRHDRTRCTPSQRRQCACHEPALVSVQGRR